MVWVRRQEYRELVKSEEEAKRAIAGKIEGSDNHEKHNNPVERA
ncbi:hypothetical protein HNY73_011705, partial [Argiope bruennichi]